MALLTYLPISHIEPILLTILLADGRSVGRSMDGGRERGAFGPIIVADTKAAKN